MATGQVEGQVQEEPPTPVSLKVSVCATPGVRLPSDVFLAKM